ncbi:uncharacterized protein LOC114463966 isoform X1 [Gouania willdenowi]|uniref:Uncharacterized LOC114463966 n=1 Tax=Gouania willdenowi TaxID=441366 RepID=A0A8C5EWV8_GOUWI|nr:uncharacterized protein LOC114463966 isoform X1 [Gouania willdenowi]XP_028303682.1 uncharacterized protein LOC114463966 isoform X1 [Gouania willdenowi]XP_028303683.1 uncharacterized protein LOC114463966 isoform X1 [Gouania willdenowi]XP_028303686.1 uncharacterized protein LOC114463966 isoform X1 [Gouania willdenowi]XP_028303687.1 uncharacterized protein LOC114463966 isoform X1 [Gouania willdenowi]
MEEAYCELYQQFLSLRSLCLKQAAMLHRLTTALEKQQGAIVPTVEFSDVMTIPVHLMNDLTVKSSHENPLPGNSTTGKCELDLLHRNGGTFSDIITQDMLKLNMNVSSQEKKEENVEQKHPFLSNPHTLICHEASQCETSHAGHRDPDDGRVPFTPQMPVIHTTSPDRHFFSPSAGEMMSDVVNDSHTCDFCQAVFPGNTSTRGDFLRHLYTHVS